MANSYLSISSMSQFYSLICSCFVLLFSLRIMYMLSHLFIAISILLLPLIYRDFTPTLSEPGSTFLLLPLIYDIFTPKLSQHASGFGVFSPEYTEEIEVFENVCLSDDTSSVDVVESPQVRAGELVHEEEESKLSVKSCDDFVTSNAINGGGCVSNLGKYECTREEEEWTSSLACKLFEEGHYNMVDGEEDMDSLWEAFEADSNKSGRMDVVVKKKGIDKKSGEPDKYYGNEDEDDDEVEMRNGCLQGFRCCSTGTGGKMNMNMTRGRSSIVKISKPFKMISWWRLLKRHGSKELNWLQSS